MHNQSETNCIGVIYINYMAKTLCAILIANIYVRNKEYTQK